MRRKNKKDFNFLKISLASIFFIGVFFILLKSSLLNIKKLDIISHQADCINNNQLKDFLKIEGQNILTLNTQNLGNAIKSKYFCIKEVSIHRTFPDKVSLNFKPRQPAAQLYEYPMSEASASSKIDNLATPSAQLYGETLLVDDEGVIFGKSNSKLSVPNIFVDKKNLSPGEKDEDIKKAIIILQKLRLFKVDAKNTFLLEDLFVIQPSPKIIFKINSEIETQIASLQLILEKAKIDSESLEFIDLRFDKPVVRLAPKKK